MTIEFPKPAKYTATVKNTAHLTPETVKIDLVVNTSVGNPFKFLPGQFITIKVSDLKYRSYSLSSNSSTPKNISVIFTCHKPGLGTNYLESLKPEDVIEFIGPSGHFVLSETLTPTILFIVTSTGVAPIFSMLEKLSSLRCNSEIKLYFGLRTLSDIFGVDFLEKCKAALSSFNYYICVSSLEKQQEDGTKNILPGRVSDKYIIKDSANTSAYVCGNPAMVSEVVEDLKSKGVSESTIFHEKFVLSKS